jgi:UrcA family protein
MSKILIAVAAFAAFSAAPAAATPTPAGARIVRYADLDLSAPAGRARLEQRIGSAVRALCGNAAPRDLNGVRDVRECEAATLANVARPALPSVVVIQSPAGTQ